MCDKCVGTEAERNAAYAKDRDFAKELDRLAARYISMSSGKIQPHSEEMEQVSSLAKKVIRKLVDDWI